jgi:hypothetical protein
LKTRIILRITRGWEAGEMAETLTFAKLRVYELIALVKSPLPFHLRKIFVIENFLSRI